MKKLVLWVNHRQIMAQKESSFNSDTELIKDDSRQDGIYRKLLHTISNSCSKSENEKRSDSQSSYQQKFKCSEPATGLC